MFCSKCGAENLDNVAQCGSCGASLQDANAAAPQQAAYTPPQPSQNISNYLVQSILVTLFCCLPLGIVAIIFSAQVNGKVQAGDTQGAIDSASKAKMWCWISFGLGLVGQLIYVALMVIGGLAEAM